MTGIEQVDTLQDSVNNAVGQQVGKGGVLQPVGDMASKEGINRAERGGKDESGSYGAGAADTVVGGAKSGGQAVAGGAQSVGSTLSSGVQSAGGYLGFGGKKEEGQQK